jgi:SAM-dependent methyltransferase
MAAFPDGQDRGPVFPGTASDRELKQRGYDLVAEHRRAVELAGFAAGDSVLDVATGSGRLAYALARAACRVVTGDIDPQVIRDTRERLGPVTCGAIEFRVLDAAHLDAADATIPALATANALHHLEDPERALEEMARVLTNDGKLLVVEFNEHGFEVIDGVHQVVRGGRHQRGGISAMAICEFLRSRFERVEHHLLPLNNVWIANGKRLEPVPTHGSVHAQCFACGPSNPHGLGLRFEADGPRGVIARCVLDDRYQGFDGIVQGGMVSLLLDSAMTNCLFRQGVRALTARLNVRFMEPVRTGVPLIVRGNVVEGTPLARGRPRLYSLRAAIEQDGGERASATGTFVRSVAAPRRAAGAG